MITVLITTYIVLSLAATLVLVCACMLNSRTKEKVQSTAVQQRSLASSQATPVAQVGIALLDGQPQAAAIAPAQPG